MDSTVTLPAHADDKIIWDTWLAVYRLPILTVADEAGLFVALGGHSLTTEELAGKLNVNPRALTVHLGVLAAMGFIERRERRWRSTAATLTWLHPQAEGYCGPSLHGFRQSEPLHRQLLATLGKAVDSDAHISATNEWERGDMPAELAKAITAYMNAHGRAAAKAVAAQPLFSRATAMLDVGGGSAIYPIEITKVHRKLKAAVLDIRVVCAEADRYIEAAGAAGNVSSIPLNMFEDSWPAGYDMHFLSNVFHDWSEETNRMLARKSFESLPAGGRIVLHEMLMDDDCCGPLATAAFSVLMLLGTRGRQYSFGELREILQAAGFIDVETWRTGSPYYSLVVARKPGAA